jgi:hypothetical protein
VESPGYNERNSLARLRTALKKKPIPIPGTRRVGRLNLGIRRLNFAGRQQMQTQARPEFCTICRGTRLVRMLWCYFNLAGEDTEAIATKQAYLGLNRRYFTSANRTLVVGEFLVKQSDLPEWVCLDCSPQWADVHRYARAEWQVAVEKNAAAKTHEFERAAVLHHEQTKLEAAHEAKYERLLRELIPSTKAGPRGA